MKSLPTRSQHRHCNAARGPDGVVDQRPLIAGMRHQPDPVAWPDAGGDEPLSQSGPVGAELRRRHILPVILGRPLAQNGHARLRLRPAEDHVREARGGRNLRQRGAAVVARWASLMGAFQLILRDRTTPSTPPPVALRRVERPYQGLIEGQLAVRTAGRYQIALARPVKGSCGGKRETPAASAPSAASNIKHAQARSPGAGRRPRLPGHRGRPPPDNGRVRPRTP